MRMPKTNAKTIVKTGSVKSGGILALFLAIGAIFGGILGELTANSESAPDMLAPYLSKTFPIFDMMPVQIDLYIIKLVLGVSFYPNIASVFGMLVAIFFWHNFSRRY